MQGEAPPSAEQGIYRTLRQDPFEFRLLQIDHDPANRDVNAPISCRMETVTLSPALRYRCLSYVWGKKEWHPISVDGKRLYVTKNLIHFLRRIRAERGYNNTKIWIDAICINQEDVEERNQQVRHMGSIYAGAQQVIAWLGRECDRAGDASDRGWNERLSSESTAEIAVEYIKDLARQFRFWQTAGGDPWTPEFASHAFDDKAMYEKLHIKPVSMKTWAAIAVFLHRQWFWRAWIVQEAALATKLIMFCGSLTLTWDDVLQISIFLHAGGWFLALMQFVAPGGEPMVPPGWHPILFSTLQYTVHGQSAPRSLGNMFPRSHEATEMDELQYLILRTMPFHATDPRDKIFAPMSLANGSLSRAKNHPLPAQGYQSDVAAIYTEISAHLIEKSSSLSLLSYAGVLDDEKDESISGLPSWVPNFAYTQRSPLEGVPGVTYDACSWPKAVKWSRENNRLELRGSFLDCIEVFGPSLHTTFVSRDMRPLVNFALQQRNKHGVDRTESLWRTLIADADGAQCPAAASMAGSFKQFLQLTTAVLLYGGAPRPGSKLYDHWESWTCFDRLHESTLEASQAIPSVEELRQFAEWWHVVAGDITRVHEAKNVGLAELFSRATGRVYGGRKLFVSKDGHMGLAPVASRTSDQIWLLAGAKVAFILRPTEHSGVFSLVGEAYFNGHMRGETRVSEGELQRVVLK